MIIAISTGRISEMVEGKSERLWDFEPGHFHWSDLNQKISIKNEGTTPLDFVEIEIF